MEGLEKESCLQVELEKKKAELIIIKKKLKKAETSKQRSQQTALYAASALVRSNTLTEDPIWVEGLDYPAQYLVRQTRSMSTQSQQTHQLLPPLCSLCHSLQDFELPDNIFHELKTVKILETSASSVRAVDNKGRELPLASSLAVDKVKDDETALLCSHFGDWVVVAIVCDRSLVVIGVSSQQLLKTWTEQPENGVYSRCARMLHSLSGWLALAVLNQVSSTNYVVRVYLFEVDGICVALTLPRHFDSAPLCDVNDLCVWNEDPQTVFIGCISSRGSVLLWKIERDQHKKFSALPVSTHTSNLPPVSKSLVYVKGADCATLVWVANGALIVWDSFAGQIKDRIAMICCSNCISNASDARVLWARLEKGVLFLVLWIKSSGLSGGGTIMLLAAPDKGQLLQLYVFHTGSQIHQVKCVPDNCLQVITENSELLTWNIGQTQLQNRIRITGCELLVCEWIERTRSVIALTKTGCLHHFYV